MVEHRAQIENNPKLLRKKALKALAVVKRQEAEKKSNGAKWQLVKEAPVRTHKLI